MDKKIKVGKDREATFDKSLRYNRQKDYDINDYDLLDFVFSTGKRKVYKNFNFSIFVNDECNADCKFCVAQLRYQHKSMMYAKEHIDSNYKYMKRLDEILKLIRPLNPSISITGGEPTLSNNLHDILCLVDEYGFRKRTITTNGTYLHMKNGVDSNMILEDLIKYKFNHLNISRTSIDNDLNQKIMRFNDTTKSNPFITSLQNIAQANEIIRDNNSSLKIRLSCLLLRESVHDVDGIRRFINEVSTSTGVDNFIFRQLMDYDKTAINTDKMKYCDDNKVDLVDVWEEMESHKEFTPYMNILGYYYYVEIYKYLHNTVAMESANLNQQYVEKNKNKDVVYEMVFHNNGNLCGSWIDKEDILNKYKA